MKPTTTNHQRARREPGSAWSRRAPTPTRSQLATLEAKSVRAPLAPRDPPRSALTTTNRSAQPAYAIHHRTLVAARGCCRSCLAQRGVCGFVGWLLVIQRPAASLRHSPPLSAGTGPRLLLSNVTLRGPLTALARGGGPTSSEAGSAVEPPGLSNVLRARGPAPESQRYAEILRRAADAAIAAPWRNRGSLCRCSLRPVRPPAQLAVWPPRGLGGQRHSAANSNVSRPASGAQNPRLHQGRTAHPRGPGHEANSPACQEP